MSIHFYFLSVIRYRAKEFFDYFSRVFKNVEGITPSEYRKKWCSGVKK
ncbi:MAG: AraC family transcriptional regulator [Acetatifactor sp.]|nr:AraC family transcriptional regulator [Acetatifactor sp.]